MAILSGPYGPWEGNKRPVSAEGAGLLGGSPPQALEAAGIGAALRRGLLDESRPEYSPQGKPLDATVQRVFGLDPSMQRGSILPIGREGEGEDIEFAAPQWLYEMAKALSLPSHVMGGGKASMGDAINMGLTVGGGGGAAGTAAAPKGALASGAAKRGILGQAGEQTSRFKRITDARKFLKDSGFKYSRRGAGDKNTRVYATEDQVALLREKPFQGYSVTVLPSRKGNPVERMKADAVVEMLRAQGKIPPE